MHCSMRLLALCIRLLGRLTHFADELREGPLVCHIHHFWKHGLRGSTKRQRLLR